MTSQYLAKQESLTKVADAIRAKSKKTDSLSFPDGFVDGIQSAGANVTIDGKAADGELNLKTKVITTYSLENLPHSMFYSGEAVSFDGKIHIMYGGQDGNNTNAHYMWDDDTWVKGVDCPTYDFDISAVVFNGEIHILGGYFNKTGHYKGDGSSWTKLATSLPYEFYRGSAVVFDDEIHIMGSPESDTGTNHYKWNGLTWTKLAKLPMNYTFAYGSAVVFNDEIHLINNYDHYKGDGSSWTKLATSLPWSSYMASAVVFNNAIHAVGGNYSGANAHYMWDGNAWIKCPNLSYSFYNGSAVVFDAAIHVLGGSASVNKHVVLNQIMYIKIH